MPAAPPSRRFGPSRVATTTPPACVRTGEIVDGAIDGEPVFAVRTSSSTTTAPATARAAPRVLSVSHLRRTFPLMKGSLVRRRVGTVHGRRRRGPRHPAR
ncbi:hypothetical protein [Pseudonocardia sp. ICBG601]|uniref:hypothetical protein n=1 Tax=Pseudonocardia sp. ICBG601 TaxID=2846759 RepID=UPI001CF6366B|nr:hypothetical protein [Pseudonocardia sp. ICBG601]